MSKRRRSRWFLIVPLLAVLCSLVYLASVPDVSKLKKENPGKTAFMEYREKEAKERGKRYRIHQTWVPLSRISPYLVKAVLIAEDDKFWRHEGFDYEAIQKAVERDIKSMKFKFGGSTLSQQLAKNLFLSPVRNPFRKLREAILTWRMEKALSKKRILEIYLNVVEWGEGIFGVEAASRQFYAKPSSELTPEEASKLASVLPNPRKYSPVGSQRYVMNRSALIFRIMIQRGIIPPDYREVTEEDGSSTKEASPMPSDPVEKPAPAY
jgi:monofunctional glycosyltransferase